MKNKFNLLFETTRMKELMGVSIISEIKLPGFVKEFVGNLGSVTFKGLNKGEFEAAFPTIAKKGLTPSVFASELANLTDLTGPQVKVLLKLNNQNLRSKLLQTIISDVETTNLVKLLIAAEKQNNPAATDLVKNKLLLFIPDEQYDNVVNTIKTNFKKEADNLAAKKLAQETEEALAKQLKATANLDDAMAIFNRVKNSTKNEVMDDAGLKNLITTAESKLKNLKSGDWKFLNSLQQADVQSALATLKSVKPGLASYVKKYWGMAPWWVQGLIILTGAGTVYGKKILGMLDKPKEGAKNVIELITGEDEKQNGGQNKGQQGTQQQNGPCPTGKTAVMIGGKIECI